VPKVPLLGRPGSLDKGAHPIGMRTRRSNKRMQLTKLRAAPERRDEVPPCARAGELDAGTASQLIRSVRRLLLGIGR
jgi:hypothetical protein